MEDIGYNTLVVHSKTILGIEAVMSRENLYAFQCLLWVWWYINAVILLYPLPPSLGIARTIYTCKIG